MPLYSHPVDCFPDDTSVEPSRRSATTNEMEDCPISDGSNSFTRWKNLAPAVRGSFGSDLTSNLSEYFETHANIALSRSLEQYGPPPEASDLMIAGRYVNKKEWCCRFQCKSSRCIANSAGT